MKESAPKNNSQPKADETPPVAIVDPATIDFEPIWDFVLMQQIESDKVSPGGVLLPDNSRGLDDCKRSVCIKAGPGCYIDGVYVPNPIKQGDVVYHAAQSMPLMISINGVKFLCTASRELMGIQRRAPSTPAPLPPASDTR